MAEEKKLEDLKEMEEAKKLADDELNEDDLDEICGGADRIRGNKVNKSTFK